MSNSNLISHTKISPNKNSPRNDQIRKITIHHVAGNMTIEQLGAYFANPERAASANYGIGTDGRIALYVPEEDRAWTSGSRENDHQAVTIEVANDGAGPAWHVSDRAFESLINLCIDICKRNKIEKINFTGDAKGNLTMHKYFQNTVCPGPYLESKFPVIAQRVNSAIAPDAVSVFEWQKAAIADGFKPPKYFPEYGSDGIWGKECEAVAKDAVVKMRSNNFYIYENLTKIVQKAVGFTGKDVDGKCGIKTDSAIKEYQKKNGLVEDGAVGINTWKTILNV